MSYNYKWQKQPYVVQKGKSTNSVVSSMSRPVNNNNFIGYWGKPVPIKHWRKRLIPTSDPNSGSGRSNIGMPMDIPSGTVYLGTDGCSTNDCSGSQVLKENLAKNPATTVTKENISRYNPEKNIIKSGKTYTKYGKKNFFNDTNAYLRSRNKKYIQNLPTGYKVDNVVYENKYPNHDISGPQTFYHANCGGYGCERFDNSGNCVSRDNFEPSSITFNKSKLIFKPSNPNFSKQTSVDSSTRILRLKEKTVNKSAKNLSVWGNEARNASKYNGNYNSPNILKRNYYLCKSC